MERPVRPNAGQPNRQISPPEQIEYFQPVRVARTSGKPQRKKAPRGILGMLLQAGLLAGLVLFFAAAAVYFLLPLRTNLLILGIDRVPEGTSLGRSDTIILVSVVPLQPVVNMLSIPRDLWVTIPGVGENRINTAHFFAEAEQPGSGPQAALRTVEENFGVSVPYYVRLRFDAFLRIVDALGGVTVQLPEDMAGLPAGTHHLDGPAALAFVRDRKGSDDFFRMEHAQFMVRAVARQMLSPLSWPRIPAVAAAVFSSVDTNLPVWLWPRLGLAFLRAVISDSISSQSISRDMATPFVTDQGASVLLPDWPAIRALVSELTQ